MAAFDVTERPVFDLGPDTSRTVYASGIGLTITVGTAKTTASMSATGVAGGGGVGSPSMSAKVSLSGIAGSTAVGTAKTTATVTVSGVAAGTGTVGDPVLTQAGQSLAEPTGIASTLAVGSPKVGIPIFPTGVAGGSVLGTAKGRVSVIATGIPSTGTTFGTAKANRSVHPTGIDSTVAFGDALTVASILVVPGPIDPSNDFGNPTVTRYGFVFRPPVNTYRWRLFKEYEGISLLKENGAWSEVAHPDLARTLTAEKYLAGGRDHVLSTSLKNELVGLGYTVTSEVVSTEEFK